MTVIKLDFTRRIKPCANYPCEMGKLNRRVVYMRNYNSNERIVICADCRELVNEQTIKSFGTEIHEGK